MKNVLVVEDEESERFTLTRLLERSGFSVTALPRGDEVLARLSAADFDALLVDVMMPGTDGISIARQVSALYPRLPIVLTSAFHFFPGQIDRLDIANVHFLDKPLDVDKLLAFLNGTSPGQRPPALRG
jgi:DNA-binding response OmpR family regulator